MIQATIDALYWGATTPHTVVFNWILDRGYSAFPVGDGWAIHRDGYPVVIVKRGSALLWNGEEITVE